MSVEEGMKMEGDKGTLTLKWHIEKGKIELDDIRCSSERLDNINQAWLCVNAAQNRCGLALEPKIRGSLLDIMEEIKVKCE